MQKIVYVDIDDTLADYTGAREEATRSNPKMVFPQAEYGFYADLNPLEGAIEALVWLLASKDYDPYILTAPSIRNPMSYTEKRIWVERHLGMEMVQRLIISPNKSLLRGDYLIDDNMSGKGQERFGGEVLHYGSTQFPDWNAVLTKFQKEK